MPAHGAAGPTQGLFQAGLHQVQEDGALFGFQLLSELQQMLYQLLFQFTLEGADLPDLGLNGGHGGLLRLEQLEEFLAFDKQFSSEFRDFGAVLRKHAVHGAALSLIQLQGPPKGSHAQGGRHFRLGQLWGVVLISEIDEGADGPEIQGQRKNHQI